MRQPGVGDLRITNIPVRFSETGLSEPDIAPELGADNASILTSLGYSQEEIMDLSGKGVI